MASLGYAEAFAKYGAKLKNVQWSVCAEAPDGSLVVSLWSHHFEKPKDRWIVSKGFASRWFGPGNLGFRDRVAKALKSRQPLRVVIAHTKHATAVDAGADASTLPKEFSVRQDWIGEVMEFDGENYAFRFRRA